MPRVSIPGVIDLVTEAPNGDFVLVMVQDKVWDGSNERLRELQAKVNTYLTYALDGPLHSQFPDSVGRSVRIELHCDEAVDARTSAFVGRVAIDTRKFGIEFSLVLRRE